MERPAEKRLLNCGSTDPNKILPMKYNWARKHYKDGNTRVRTSAPRRNAGRTATRRRHRSAPTGARRTWA